MEGRWTAEIERELEAEAERRRPDLQWANDDPPGWMMSAQAAAVEQIRRERAAGETP